MLALVKGIAQVGLGALLLTLEKAKALVDALVKRREVRRDEAKDVADRMTTGGEVACQALRKVVNEETELVLSGLNLATLKDIDTLSKKMEALSTQMEAFLN